MVIIYCRKYISAGYQCSKCTNVKSRKTQQKSSIVILVEYQVQAITHETLHHETVTVMCEIAKGMQLP